MLRRSVRAGVDEFVAARVSSLLRTAYLLTGAASSAESLLQAALAEVAASWDRGELGPDLAARRAMVRLRSPWWSVRGERPVPFDGGDRELFTALVRLPRRQRAALVLREVDGLPDDDLAVALDCSEPAALRLLDHARSRLGPGELRAALVGLAEALARSDPEAITVTVPDRLDDVQHRVDVRRAWRRTEVVASLFVATAAVVTVVAVLPTPPSRTEQTPEPDMIEPPPTVAGHRLGPVMRVNDVDYEYFRSEETPDGRPLLRVAVAPERHPQSVAWMSTPGDGGRLTLTVDGNRVGVTRAGRSGLGALLSAHRMHLVTVTASRPDAALRLGVAFYQWPTP